MNEAGRHVDLKSICMGCNRIAVPHAHATYTYTAEEAVNTAKAEARLLIRVGLLSYTNCPVEVNTVGACRRLSSAFILTYWLYQSLYTANISNLVLHYTVIRCTVDRAIKRKVGAIDIHK